MMPTYRQADLSIGFESSGRGEEAKRWGAKWILLGQDDAAMVGTGFIRR